VVRGFALTASKLSRTLRLGAGTSVPGLIVQRLDPGYLRRRAGALEAAVVVSGTNGKTTTTAMIDAILTEQGIPTISNPSGANLFRGVATAIVHDLPPGPIGVFEVDEGALERLVPALRPTVLVLTNVFRDQLDRFGEPETVARLLQAAARRLPEGTTVVANADDPLLWHLVADLGAVGFGVRWAGVTPALRTGGEPEICPRCGGTLRYSRRTMAHLGAAACSGCGWSSSAPMYEVVLRGPMRLGPMPAQIDGMRFVLQASGVSNAYNAAAAIAAADAIGVGPWRSRRALERFQPRFGRGEALEFGDATVWLMLTKNPAGAAAVVAQVAADQGIGAVVVAVSDGWADGRDISWIWDADFECLASRRLPIVASGRRASDVAVRLKYAGANPMAVHPDPVAAISAATECAGAGGDIVVLATYTAMLDVRHALLGSRTARVANQQA